jgi:hypothetical protein
VFRRKPYDADAPRRSTGYPLQLHGIAQAVPAAPSCISLMQAKRMSFRNVKPLSFSSSSAILRMVGRKLIHVSRNLFHRRGHAAIFWYGQDLACDLGRKVCHRVPWRVMTNALKLDAASTARSVQVAQKIAASVMTAPFRPCPRNRRYADSHISRIMPRTAMQTTTHRM